MKPSVLVTDFIDDEESCEAISNTNISVDCVSSISGTSFKSLDCLDEDRIDLKTFLNSSNEGKRILKHYEIHKELKRKLLVNLIISHELRNDPDKR